MTVVFGNHWAAYAYIYTHLSSHFLAGMHRPLPQHHLKCISISLGLDECSASIYKTVAEGHVTPFCLYIFC